MGVAGFIYFCVSWLKILRTIALYVLTANKHVSILQQYKGDTLFWDEFFHPILSFRLNYLYLLYYLYYELKT